MAKYENCKIISKSGQLIGYCGRSKLEWYLKKELGSLIDEKSVQLNFDPIPKNYQNFEIYESQERKNICVVCGLDKFLNKCHIVPLEFRKWFPLEKKSHKSHDILLLCK